MYCCLDLNTPEWHVFLSTTLHEICLKSDCKDSCINCIFLEYTWFNMLIEKSAHYHIRSNKNPLIKLEEHNKYQDLTNSNIDHWLRIHSHEIILQWKLICYEIPQWIRSFVHVIHSVNIFVVIFNDTKRQSSNRRPLKNVCTFVI